ncbi:MAG TPA: NAD-dependent epimerase/dehydratase family protein, partial [Candidatus Omnitrophota bacterium]|nr:NAD-dependent epimerase/dehydratase family protein [Candidatus Omnitrophota bacterium]
MASRRKLLVTGSGGLVGSQSVRYFSSIGFEVFGIDNDMRSYFFGDPASTKPCINRLKKDIPGYRHFFIDIRDSAKIRALFRSNIFDLVIHAASQPSHDWAARDPVCDFQINSAASLNLLENLRKFSPEAVFVFISTNKVYGDRPNYLP